MGSSQWSVMSGARRAQRRGVVLAVVMVIVALLVLAAYTFSQAMLTERRATKSFVRQGQARMLAESGIDAARMFFTQDADTMLQNGGVYDNPGSFQAQVVVPSDTPYNQGRFSLIAPLWDGTQITGVRYGLENESAKLNLNMVMAAEKAKAGTGQQILMTLPGMSQDIADAILDWMDSDTTVREQGAESDEYSGMPIPYVPRNGPPGSIEELLSVRGITPGLLFGSDINRNGVIDGAEASGMSFGEADNSDSSMDAGWSAYLTLTSAEANIQSDGTPKVNINQKDMQALHDALDQCATNHATFSSDWANFIVLYRQYGPAPPGGASGGGGNATTLADVQIDYQMKAKTNIDSILDLVDARVAVTQGNGRTTSTRIYQSPLKGETDSLASSLPDLMDALTTTSAKTIAGRININQAPPVVLATIPGLSDQPDIISSIISQRSMDPATAPDSSRKYATWILSEQLVTLAQMKQILPYVTAGGDVYKVQSVGYFDQGGPSARIEAIIDTTIQPARVLFWKDMTNLGRGLSNDILGVGSGQ